MEKRIFRSLSAAGACALLLAAPRPARAFAFQPSVVEFTLADGQLSKTFTAENTGDAKVAVQISARARETDLDGKETLPPTDHFSVFPKQLILGPNESKTIRVTYTGPKTIAKEAPYRIVAEQLPVDLKSVQAGAGTNLKFLIKYQTSAYVVPARARAKIVVESVRAVGEKTNDRRLELVFRNDGGAHRILNRAKIVLRDSKNPRNQLPLPADGLKELETVNVLAGEKRRVLLPWPAGASKTPGTTPGTASGTAFDAASIDLD